MKIKDIVTFVSKSITPQKGVTYNLYSLPSFDEGKTFEVLDGADIQSNKYDVPNKCILFNKLNVRFKRVWRIDSHDENKIASTEFLPLVVDEDVVDFQYCYYLLISDKITNYLCGQNTNTSGSHKRIDPDNFLNIEIKLPKMSIQRQVGKTLSALDRKIVLNKQINDNLEAMAKQLYDYWFVQFDFPNEEGKPYKSSGGAMVWNEKLKREIPQGWDFCFLENLLTIKNGRDHKHLADGIYPVYGSGGEMRKASEYLYDGESVLMPRKGSLNNIMYVNEAFWTVDTMFYSEMKQSNCAKYIYYTIKDIDFTRWDSGTGVPSMTSSTLYSIKLVKPQSEILKKFDEVISPLFEHMKQISEQNSVLTKQRDELIPLLMNGQASINYHLSASTSISFDISFLFLNFTNGNSLYEIIGLDYQCFALPLHSKENTHGTIQEDKRHIQ